MWPRPGRQLMLWQITVAHPSSTVPPHPHHSSHSSPTYTKPNSSHLTSICLALHTACQPIHPLTFYQINFLADKKITYSYLIETHDNPTSLKHGFKISTSSASSSSIFHFLFIDNDSGRLCSLGSSSSSSSS